MNTPIREATGLLMPGTPSDAMAAHIEAAIKSAVRAVLPGRQQKKNLDPLLADAYKAAARTLRRRARHS